MHRNFGNPGSFARPELTVIAGSLSEPRREIEQTVAPLREMRGLGVLWVLWALSIGTCLAMAWEWLS